MIRTDEPPIERSSSHQGGGSTSGLRRRPVVQKYGGSSLASIEKVRRVANRIVRTHDSGQPVVAVVSAMGNTTSELIGRAKAVNDSPPSREMDMLLSSGERMSMALLAMAIEDEGRAAISLTGPQSGIVTDDNHANANIEDVRPERVRAELAAGRVVIVAGYQGASREGEVTTLGRGGSDTTAVALAAALDAEACEICSDVAGVYTADPRMVEEPLHLKRVESLLMSEYARHGARVLHPPCLDHARKNRMSIRARATFGGDESTTIAVDSGLEYSNVPEGVSASIVGVASRSHRVRVEHPGADQEVERAIRDALGEVEIFHHGAARPRAALDWLIDTGDVPDPEETGRGLAARLAKVARVTPGLSTVTVVAPTAASASLRGSAVAALNDAGTPVLASYVQPLSFTCAVRPEDRAAAVRVLHERLLESSLQQSTQA